jgi:hypothetical protein
MEKSQPPRPHGDPLREQLPAEASELAADAQEADRHESGEPEPEPQEAPPSRPHGDPMRADTRSDERLPDSRVH